MPVMKRKLLYAVLALTLAFLLAPGAQAFAEEAQEVGYRLAVSEPDSGEIAVTLQMEAGSGPVYGVVHIPCKIDLNHKLTPPPPEDHIA